MTNRAMKLLGLSGQKRQTTKSRYQLSSDWAKEVNALRVWFLLPRSQLVLWNQERHQHGLACCVSTFHVSAWMFTLYPLRRVHRGLFLNLSPSPPWTSGPSVRSSLCLAGWPQVHLDLITFSQRNVTIKRSRRMMSGRQYCCRKKTLKTPTLNIYLRLWRFPTSARRNHPLRTS